MFKLMKAERRYYSKIILYFVLFTFLLISLLSILLYTNYRSYSLKLISHSNQEILQQISENMGKINEHSSIYMNTIFNNPSTTSLLYNADYDILDHLNNIKALNSLLIAHPYVHSIYVYNAKDDVYHIIGDQTLVRKGEIYDSEISGLVQGPPYKNPIPRKIPYSEMEKEKMINVYTYIMKGMKANNSDKFFAVVVNVFSNAFFDENIKEKDIHDRLGEIYCINTQGFIMGSIDPEMFLNTSSSKPYIDRVINAKEDGYFITDDTQNKKLITYIKAPVSDWILINEVPYTQVVSMLDKVKVVTGMIILTNLIIGCVIAFLFSRSLYSPIDQLKRVVGPVKENRDKHNETLSELDMIAVHFQKMQYSMNKLQSLNRDSIQYIKNGLLVNILKGSVIEPVKIKELLEQCNIKFSLEHPAIIVILRIDHYQKKYVERFTGDLQVLYKFALNNISLEVISKQYALCESIDPGEDYTVTIISLYENEINYNEIVKNLENCIQQIQENYYDFIQVSISGFISSIASNLYEVGEIYNEALELAKQRFLYGHGCIINREHYTTFKSQSGFVYEEQINALIEALKTSKYEGVVNTYYQIMNQIKNTNYDNILFVANYLSNIVINTILLIERNTKVQLNIDSMEFNRAILKCETMKEMDKIFEEMFKRITTNMDHAKNNKSDDVVYKVNEYIEGNYMFETLCIANIADHVGLTPRYLNRVYSQGCARSISDYIKEIRLNQAAKLLIETDNTIEKILEQIGWTTKEYFYICFKKQFGVTPRDYRLQQQNN